MNTRSAPCPRRFLLKNRITAIMQSSCSSTMPTMPTPLVQSSRCRYGSPFSSTVTSTSAAAPIVTARLARAGEAKRGCAAPKERGMIRSRPRAKR